MCRISVWSNVYGESNDGCEWLSVDVVSEYKELFEFTEFYAIITKICEFISSQIILPDISLHNKPIRVSFRILTKVGVESLIIFSHGVKISKKDPCSI